MASADFWALAARFAVGCRLSHAFGVLHIPAYSLSTSREHLPDGMGSVLLRAPNRLIVR